MTHDLPLSRLKPGALNPRKNFDAGALAELSASIESDGVLSNLIVRPAWCMGAVTAADLDKAAKPAGSAQDAGTMFEIVSGERRYRAAKAAGERNPGLRDMKVPVRVKAMTDPDVLAINLTEQMQRNELRPLEEADGFAALLAYKDAAGKPLHTPETLAARVGKAHDYVQERLNLRKLPPALKKAVNDGTVPPTVARSIARIPDATLREEAAKEMLTGGRDGGQMTRGEVVTLIEEKYMVSLQGAPFNQEDPDLVPAAGKCSGCKLRTGNMPEYQGVRGKRTDTCTNPVCYRAKCQGAFMVLVAEANRAGVTVLTDKDSARHFEPVRTSEVRVDGEWVELDTRPMPHLLKTEVKDAPTWRELEQKAVAAGMKPEVVLAKDGGGRGRWLVNSTLLITAAAKLGEPIFKGQKGEDDEPVSPKAGEDANDTFARGKREHAEKQRQDNAAKAEEARLRDLVVGAQVRAVHAGLVKSWVKAPIWEEMLRCFMLAGLPLQWVLHRVLATKETDPLRLTKLINKQPEAQRQALVPLMLAANSLHDLAAGQVTHTPALSCYARLAGVDLKAVAKSAAEPVASKQPKKSKPKRGGASAKAVAAVNGRLKKRGGK